MGTDLGSISGFPNFPYIPEGYTEDQIDADKLAAETDYTEKKAAFDAANILLKPKADALLEARTALQEVYDNSLSTQTEIDEAKAAYKEAFEDFTRTWNQTEFADKADALVTTSYMLFASATNYVSALARKQMMTAQINDPIVEGYVDQLYTLFNPIQVPGEPLPVSPHAVTPETPRWMLTAIVEAYPESSADERQAIIDAFNEYRQLEWQIADGRQTFIQSYMEHLKAYYAWLASGDPGDPSLKEESNEQFYNASQAYSIILTLTAKREAAYQKLDTALISFGGALREAFKYLKSGEDLKNHLMEKFSASFLEGYAEKVAADQAAKAAYLEEFPSESLEFIEERAGSEIMALEQAQRALLPTSIEVPVLPPASSALSMSDLMRIISAVKLWIEKISRYVSEADSRLGIFTVGYFLLELAVEQARYEAFQEWISIVNEADSAYNAGINEANITAADEADSILINMEANEEDITSLIDEINSQTEEWNTFVQRNQNDLVNACKDIDQSLVDTINADRETYPEAPNYLDFFDFDEDVPAPDELEYTEPISFGTDIPTINDPFNAAWYAEYKDVPELRNLLAAYKELIEDPELLDDATFRNEYHIPNEITTTAELVAYINTSMESFLREMSPALDQIKAYLDVDVDLKKLYMKELLEPREFPTYTATYLYQLTSAVLKIIRMSDIAEEDRVSMNQFLAGVIKLIIDKSAERERMETTSSGVSFGISAVELEEGGSTVSRFISKLAQTDILVLTLSRTIEAASIVAGLVAAGGGISGLGSSMGISAAELFGELGVDQTKFVGQQTTQGLLFAFAEQLALFAGKTPSLKQNALNVISQIPGGQNLSQKDVEEILAFLLMFQQLLLLFMSMLMASHGGMSSSQFLTQVLAGAGGSADSMLRAFQALGLPMEKAIALGVALGGGATDLQNLLRSMGLDESSSSIILALIAAQKGKISLTEGVMGGPGYLDAMIQKLKDAGIIITARIGTDEFMLQLTQALEAKANEDQLAILRSELQRIEEVNTAEAAKEESLSDLFDELMKGIASDIEQKRVEGPPGHLAPLIRPSEVLAQYVNEFKLLPGTVQAELIGLAQKNLAGVTGISDEQKAALMIAVRLGRATVTEALVLAELARRESLGILSYSDMETKIISKLFKESPEALLAREEALKRAIIDEEVRMRELLPTAFTQRMAENMRESLFRFVNNFEDKKLAIRVVERFSKFIERLSDMTKVSVLLLDPGRIPMLLFSPRLGNLPQGRGGAQIPPSILGV